jgi:MinD-like ATPase involved in chromosome partitioning or flagellar assembly
VIIDTRASLTDDVLTFLDAADVVLQVLTFEMMSIRSVAMAGETFAAIGYPPNKIVTVLNRSDASAGFDKAYIEEIIKSPIHFEVVSDGRLVLNANNDGRAFVVSHPDMPIAQGVRRIADSLAANQRERAPALAGR